ncbi:MAG: quinone oxidoreductase [Rhodospirillales bacterium]
MSKAIRIHATGGPEVLRWENVPVPEPGPGEVLLRHEAVGLNYIDVYFRNGLYKLPNLPAVIGQEGAGVVEALGEGVTSLKVGDRVAYAGSLGAYAMLRVIPADRVIKLPDGVSSKVAAAIMLQGLTAHYLIHRTHAVKPGETILVHAAAGGVGLLLCQWASHLGARVIGVVSSAAKADLAKAAGAAHTIVGTATLAADVKRITGGEMVPVVYDSVGRDTFLVSLDCLAPLGLMVSFGNSSGPVPPFELSLLSAKGSLFITRPSLATYTAKRPVFEKMAADLFAAVAAGVLHASINQTFPLSEAAAAHAALEGRHTTGQTVLIP